jgi:acyl transferase domain-containing protein
MRVLIGVGVYSEAADETRGSGSTTLALRLKYEGQGEELTQNFPGTYVSAITEPLNISIVGPAGTLHELFIFAKEQEQLQVQKMDIRGKSHNPENQKVAGDLRTVCDGTESLRLPDASELRAPVRSNISGRRLSEGSLTNELVTTILANRCEWYSILTQTAKDIKAQSNDTPGLVYFGMTDVVSLAPFVQQGLQPVKTAAHTLIARITKSPVNFPEDAIAVVGASCRLPGANNFEELWELLASGADQHRPFGTDRFNIYDSFRASQSRKFGDSKFYGNFIDDVRRFDNAFFGVNQREAASMDPQQRLLLEIAYEALDDAGYLAKHCRENGDNVGCFIGGSLVEYLDNTSAYAPTAYVASGTIRAFLCGRLSYYFGWSGPAEVIDTACSSSLVAINRACKAIQAGECPMALCGGVNIITGMNNYFDLGKAGFLSPTGQCKPFDASGDGYCRSDGVGLVVLKKLSQAIVDGDAVMAVIPGISTNQGGLSPSITIPHSTAQQALYKRVLQQAQIPPENITYIETHGTGTQAGDPIEVESLRSVFGKKMLKTSSDRTLHIGSIKGNLGHCETAAGVTGLLKVLAMIKHAQLPPHASYGSLNPKIPALEPDGLSINRSLCDWKTPFRAALVNSYGAAGSNCALLCCEMPSKKNSRTKDVDVKLPLLVSAASEKSLLQNAQVLSAHLRKRASEINLGDLAHTLNERRKRHKFLMPIEAVDVQDAASHLENLQFQSIVQYASRTPRPVVLVFSGQFDSKVQLDKAFYDKIPAFRHYIDLCDKELVAQGFPTIMPTIFDTEPAADATLLQCGIFAMQYASAQCWIDAGLTPSAVIGHSLGELTALAVSGVLSLADAIKLVASRARLIDTKWGSDKGSMLAMSNCSASEFEAICSLLQQRSGSVIEIACYNAVDTIIASGASTNIARLKEIMCSEPRFQKIRARDLATTHGFHSSLTETLLADMTATLQSLK